MVENLSEHACVGVSAVVLLFSTGFSLYLIYLYCKNYHYPAAQRLCIVLFAMPIFIGWASWVDLLTINHIKVMGFVINLYKSICVACFVFYIDRLIGWTDANGTNEYSSARVTEVLLSMKKADCYLKCFRSTMLETEQQVAKYRFRTRICILQFPVALGTVGIIGLFLYATFDKSPVAADTAMSSYWLWVTGIQILSSIVAVNALINYAVFAEKIPELEGLSVLRKFILIKLSMILTEAQPVVISIFAAEGLIADTSEYSLEEIVEYTNSLLLCSEMIIAGFLQFLVFPVDEYKESPMCRKSIAIASEMNSYLPLQGKGALTDPLQL